MASGEKAADAFRTIGELSIELGVAQHVLRYWETRFPQLRPLQRAGNRRYYRPAEVALAGRINRLLNEEGYTVRGVQKLLAEQSATPVPEQAATPALEQVQDLTPAPPPPSFDIQRLIRLRDTLRQALSA